MIQKYKIRIRMVSVVSPFGSAHETDAVTSIPPLSPLGQVAATMLPTGTVHSALPTHSEAIRALAASRSQVLLAV